MRILSIQTLLHFLHYHETISNVLGFSPSLTKYGNALVLRTLPKRKIVELKVINDFSFSNLSPDREKEPSVLEKKGATFNPKDIEIIPRSEIKGADCALDDEECKRINATYSQYPFVDMLRDSVSIFMTTTSLIR